MNLTPEAKATLLEAAAVEARGWAIRRAGAPQVEALASEADELEAQAVALTKKLLQSVLPEVTAAPREQRRM
jgi:hypothetical protein